MTNLFGRLLILALSFLIFVDDAFDNTTDHSTGESTQKWFGLTGSSIG